MTIYPSTTVTVRLSWERLAEIYRMAEHYNVDIIGHGTSTVLRHFLEIVASLGADSLDLEPLTPHEAAHFVQSCVQGVRPEVVKDEKPVEDVIENFERPLTPEDQRAFVEGALAEHLAAAEKKAEEEQLASVIMSDNLDRTPEQHEADKEGSFMKPPWELPEPLESVHVINGVFELDLIDSVIKGELVNLVAVWRIAQNIKGGHREMPEDLDALGEEVQELSKEYTDFLTAYPGYALPNIEQE